MTDKTDDTPAPFMDADEKEIEQKMIKTIQSMPKEVQDRFKVLHMLSDKRSKLNDEFNEACKKLEAKILEKKKPFLDQRKDIIAGETESYGDLTEKFDTTHEDLKTKVAAIVKPPKKEGEEEDPVKEPLDVSYLKGKKGVPDFWVRAIKSNKLIMDEVKPNDEKIIDLVTHVETMTKENEETKNMELTLSMTFQKENDFFTNETLSVTLEFEDEESVKEVRGTKIDWKDGKDVTQKKIKKKQKHKKTGETRTVVKTVDANSFFNIFKDKKVTADGQEDSEDENDARDKIDEVQQSVEDFHDLLIPEALEYYLGLNEDFDMLGMDPEGEESGDDDSENDDADDDKKGKPGSGDGAGADGQQQECKQ